MTNTIPNVPRELLEELRDAANESMNATTRQHQIDHFAGLIAKADALLSAPSPAGVDGLEVATFLHTLHMELGQTEQFCSKWKGDPFGVSGVDYSSTYSVTSEPLCRLSDAQTIIDGLRGDLLDTSSERNAMQRERDAYKLLLDRECTDADAILMDIGLNPDELRTDGGFLMVAHVVNRIVVQRDQQARRIGEAVEVVAYRGKDPDGGEGFVGARWPDAFGEDCIVEPLMTVAQYQRIMAAATHPTDQGAEPDAELVELLRACHSALYPFDNKMLEAKIDAALSAGKEVE